MQQDLTHRLEQKQHRHLANIVDRQTMRNQPKNNNVIITYIYLFISEIIGSDLKEFLNSTHVKMERNEKNMAALTPPVPTPAGGSAAFPH